MPVSALGGSTQHFRAYGKRKTNVINRRQPLAAWNASPAATTRLSSSSSDDSSDEDEHALAPVDSVSLPAPTKKTSVPRRLEFQVVVEVPAPCPVRPSQTAPRPFAGKENPSGPVRATVMGKGKAKAKVVQRDQTSDDDSDDRERSPLKPRARPVSTKRVYGGRRTTTTTTTAARPSSSSEEEEDAVVVVAAPARRTGSVRSSASSVSSRQTLAQPRKRVPVIVSDDDCEEDDVDGLLEDRPLPVLADEASSSASSDGEGSAASAADEQPATRSRPSASRTGRLPAHLHALQPLLLDPTPFSFPSFVASPPAPFAPSPTWRKIGEASYSEVFATPDEDGRDMVVKIIPIASPTAAKVRGDVELPFMSSWDAVAREIEVSRELGGEDAGVEGFVRFRGAFLVQGAYPTPLLSAWDAFKRAQRAASDEQVRPHVLPDSQLYALLLLENAGVALESFRLRSWAEAAGVMAQVVDALARAEGMCEFEHRDLHWGNILLQPASAPKATSLPDRFSRLALARTRESTPPPPFTSPSPASTLDPRALLDPAHSGVRATLIDFTLSRCVASGSGARVLFDAFDDDELFDGEGEYQFEVYRLMRALVDRTDDGWRASERRTNVLWLHYLAQKLLHSKRLRAPPPPAAAGAPAPPGPRAVPSPLRPVRRPLTRRVSTALPTPSLLSPAPPRARARTAPALVSGPGSGASGRTYAVERAAHATLVRAESALATAVEGWALGGASPIAVAAGRRKGAGSSAKKTLTARGGNGGFAGAREFAEWWFAGV
ncbi:hypothetical protein JCM3770_006796 [Rhodotorula araucariae]